VWSAGRTASVSVNVSVQAIAKAELELFAELLLLDTDIELVDDVDDAD